MPSFSLGSFWASWGSKNLLYSPQVGGKSERFFYIDSLEGALGGGASLGMYFPLTTYPPLRAFLPIPQGVAYVGSLARSPA